MSGTDDVVVTKVAVGVDTGVEDAEQIVCIGALGATAAALENKRRRDGLTHRQVAAALELTPAAYWNLRRIPCAPLRTATCGRIARWLAVPTEDVLRWEGLLGSLLTGRKSVRSGDY